MTDIIFGGNRDGSITKEQAIKRFNEYYEGRAKSAIGRFRAKLFDMMYQKKPEKTLEPGTPGSIKYMLEEGPRTFDMEGVDSFPEGDEFVVHNENITDKYTSKGSTYRKDGDSEESIYGPRLSGQDDKLYSTHFREVYNERKRLDGDVKGSLKNNNLVEIYWNKYREGGIERKNKKDKKEVRNLTFGAFLPGAPICTLNAETMEIFINDTGELLNLKDYNKQIDFLLRLELLNNTDEHGFKLLKKAHSTSVLKVSVSVIDQSDEFYYRISDGMAVDEDCSDMNIDFYQLFQAMGYELGDIDKAEKHLCDKSEVMRSDSLEILSSGDESVVEEPKETGIFGDNIGEESLQYDTPDDDEEEISVIDTSSGDSPVEESVEKPDVVSAMTSSSEDESGLEEEDDEDDDEEDEDEEDEDESGLEDDEEDEDLKLGDLGEELAFLSSDDEGEESDDEEDDEESVLSGDQAEVLANLSPSIANLPGMEEAMKDLDM